MSDTEIVAIDVADLDLALNEPFGIAGGAQTSLRNLVVHVQLRDGTRGLGEAAPFPAFNGETREAARTAIERITPSLVGADARSWRPLAARLLESIPDAGSARCAIETAVLDALAKHHHVPLWVFFGGARRVLETDLTITTGDVPHARSAATRIAHDGYRTIKLKVGGVPLDDDIERIRAVHDAAPGCGILLDANASMRSYNDALTLLDEAASAGARIVLFEQPLDGDDLEGMAALTARSPVPIAADESADSLESVLEIAHRRAAHAINLKITKSGVVRALEMAMVARAHGLRLMIGGMVESDVAMSMSAHLAAGLGGFEWVDLDTPLWLVNSPVRGGYDRSGPFLDVSGVRAGHGAHLATERDGDE